MPNGEFKGLVAMGTKRLKVVVVGAGAFGGWTALHLLRRGAAVTLVDAWGPGNPRASSGGETRIIRGTYGPGNPYTQMSARAMRLWRENERRWNKKLVFPIGVLFMAAKGDDAFERGSIAYLKEANVQHERLTLREMSKRWPQVNFEGIDWGLFESKSGYLLARASCQAVLEGFVAEGGTWRQAAVRGDDLEADANRGVQLTDGSKIRADRYVFACGPWMGSLFPQTIGKTIEATKQDVFFFGTPAGDARFSELHLPVWADHRGRFMYGIPGHGARAFKVADDTRGPEFDPTSGERAVSDERLRLAREYVEFRFPGMKGAPLIKGRVCQYGQTRDGNFVVDRHPQQPQVWLVGGGSGHGFKHGPALGEMVAKLVMEDGQADSRFQLARFAAAE
jgi:glycine/D-amino acid oxidase-like deaminating enzyme